MFQRIFNEVSQRYSHLDGYLEFRGLKEAFKIADAHYPDIAVKFEPSIIAGCFDFNNKYSRELFSAISKYDRDDRDRLQSFMEIFAEKYKLGTKEAITAAFDHFDRIADEYPEYAKAVKSRKPRFASVIA